jgi:site-specific DNA-cytosine methylase
VRTLWFTKSRRAQNVDDYETWIEGGVMPTLNAFDNGDVRTTILIKAYDEYNDSIADTHHTLRSGTKQSTGVIMETNVRRLTPVECERLQGFPDDWTAGQSDSHRYKQMGNAVAVPVVEWIVQGIVDVAKVS